MDEIKLTYVEPAEYFPKEIREKYFKDIEDEYESSQKKTDEDKNTKE